MMAIQQHLSRVRYADHEEWDSPENLAMDNRPAFSISEAGPGSELAGETAAALAATSVWFRQLGEEEYADTCLQHARTLLDFADQFNTCFRKVHGHYPGRRLLRVVEWLQ